MSIESPLTSAVDLANVRVGYDGRAALHCAELCRLAYQPPDVALMLASRPGGSIEGGAYGYRMSLSIDAGATEGMILATPKVISVVWRGTSSVRDWRDDLRIARVRWPYGPGRVHAGFWAQLKRARQQLMDGLVTIRSKPEYSHARIYVMGHSLGGAIATLSAIMLENLGLPVAATYSFEAPRPFGRVAAEDHADVLGSSTHRVVCVHPKGQMDLITRTPPGRRGPWPLGWWHPICTPRIHWRDKIYTSKEAWENMRSNRPLGIWRSMRIITNTLRATSVHDMDYVVDTLAVVQGNDLKGRIQNGKKSG